MAGRNAQRRRTAQRKARQRDVVDAVFNPFKGGKSMLKTCGNCANGVLDSRITGKDLTKRICFGGPPSVVGVPMPGPGNTMRFSLQNARPAVDVNDRACGQWEPRSVIEGVISPVEGEKKETTQ